MPHSFCLHPFDVLASTQIEAREGVEQGRYQTGDAIIAAMQSAGYGRRGRAWQSPVGNLSMTFVEDFSDPEHLQWLGYAVGLGLFDAVQSHLPYRAKLQLKWPNDLLLDSKKLAGLLLEICNDNILIGMGMNIDVLPETDQAVTKLHHYTNNFIGPTDLAKQFFGTYQHWRSMALTQGFSPLRKAWLQRAAFLKQPISARLANKQVLTGTFEDIDEQGALVLMTESGHHIVTTADIYLNTD